MISGGLRKRTKGFLFQGDFNVFQVISEQLFHERLTPGAILNSLQSLESTGIYLKPSYRPRLKLSESPGTSLKQPETPL